MKQDKSQISTDDLFRIVIINMYITHSILHRVKYNLINFYEFAIYINPACAELVLKAFQLGHHHAMKTKVSRII